MSSTLYLARILESGPARVVVECVTVHPDAGMPPTDEEASFLARLLAEARERPDDGETPFIPVDRIRASRRLHTIDIEFTDEFWRQHDGAWWTREPVTTDTPLRDWLSGPSDNAPYQVVAFEAHVDPDCLSGLTTDPFESAAYW